MFEIKSPEEQQYVNTLCDEKTLDVITVLEVLAREFAPYYANRRGNRTYDDLADLATLKTSLRDAVSELDRSRVRKLFTKV